MIILGKACKVSLPYHYVTTEGRGLMGSLLPVASDAELPLRKGEAWCLKSLGHGGRGADPELPVSPGTATDSVQGMFDDP